MADFEYVDVNGRQIRVRPRETAQEIDEYGNFHRQPNRFTEGFGEGKNPVEKDRYILFWAKGCNWSNRAAIARELLGLEDAVKVEIVDWTDREENLGWEFVNSPDHINPETGAQFLSELYYNADEESLGNAFIGLIKGTSLAFVCSVVEMTAEGKILAGRNYRYFEVYISLAIIYWVITFVLERVISYLEKKLRVPEDAPALLDIRDTEVE